MIWNVFAKVFCQFCLHKSKILFFNCWQVWWLETTLSQIKGQKKTLKKQKLSSWAAHIVQVVIMFIFTGTDSIQTKNRSIYYTKVLDPGVLINTPLTVGFSRLHHKHPLNSLLLMYVCQIQLSIIVLWEL